MATAFRRTDVSSVGGGGPLGGYRRAPVFGALPARLPLVLRWTAVLAPAFLQGGFMAFDGARALIVGRA
jgi:hypothetical protein